MPGQFRVPEIAWAFSIVTHLGLGWALLNQGAPEMAVAPAPQTNAMQIVMFDARGSLETAAAATATEISASPAQVRPLVETTSPQPAPVSTTSASELARGEMGVEAAAGPAGGVDLDAFQRRLLAHIARFKTFPAGETPPASPTLVRFVLRRDGTVADMWIYSSSGVERFDQAAMETLSRAQPLPNPPVGLPDPLNVMLPVTFVRSGG